MKNLNLANKLTLFRIVLIPFFVFFYYFEYHSWVEVAAVIFIVACITDWLDGFIARKYNMVTDLGKFLDPLADKILVISALICFSDIYWFPTWTVIVIVAREFVVTGFRMAVVAKDNKAVIAADIWGKIKTAATMITIIFMLGTFTIWSEIYYRLHEWTGDNTYLYQIDNYIETASLILIYICTALTVFSGVTMIYKNRKLFSE